jgi:hypothetical protein
MRVAPVILFALLPGCATTAERPLRPLEIASAPFVDSTTASATGSLMYEADCLLFRDESAKRVYLPVWPSGSTFNGTSVTVHEPAKADQRIVLGEQFRMDGRPVEWTQMTADYYDRFHRACGGTPFFVTAVKPAN